MTYIDELILKEYNYDEEVKIKLEERYKEFLLTLKKIEEKYDATLYS